MVNTSIKKMLVRGILLGCLSATGSNLGMKKSNQLQFYALSLNSTEIVHKIINNRTDINDSYTLSPAYNPNDMISRTIIHSNDPINIQKEKYDLPQDLLAKLSDYQQNGQKIFVHKSTENEQLIQPIQEIIITKPQVSISYQRFDAIEYNMTPPYEEYLEKNSLEKKELTERTEEIIEAIDQAQKNIANNRKDESDAKEDIIRKVDKALNKEESLDELLEKSKSLQFDSKAFSRSSNKNDQPSQSYFTKRAFVWTTGIVFSLATIYFLIQKYNISLSDFKLSELFKNISWSRTTTA